MGGLDFLALSGEMRGEMFSHFDQIQEKIARETGTACIKFRRELSSDWEEPVIV